MWCGGSGRLFLLITFAVFLLLECLCAPRSKPAAQDGLECDACILALSELQQLLDGNATLAEVFPIAEFICEIALNHAGKNGDVMCRGLIYSYGPAVQYALTHTIIDPRDLCWALHLCNKTHAVQATDKSSLLLNKIQQTIANSRRNPHNSEKGAFAGDFKPLFESKEVFEDGSHALPKNGYVWQEDPRLNQEGPHSKQLNSPKPSSSDETFTVLHLTDIHMDQNYMEGAPTDCQYFICCRNEYPGNGSAGRYGDYKCDLPVATLELLVETIKALEPRPDFIIYTGDNPPHDIWKESFESQLAATKFVVDYLAEKLPGYIIYPSMGNHESFPESEYYTVLDCYKDLTRTLVEYWGEWVDFPLDVLPDLYDGAYYSLLIRDGLRIISYNSNYMYSFNFYSFLNDKNPYFASQQQWLVNELDKAESAGERVLILTHIPPGDLAMWPDYGEFVTSFTKRFTKTIIAILVGHTHFDQFQLVYDADGAYGVVLVAPAVTTYSNINPSFRVFTMDNQGYQFLSYDQYFLNITKANELAKAGKNASFELSYSTDEAYGMKDLSPDSWNDLVKRFESDDSVLSKYHYNYHTKTGSLQHCGFLCKHEVICSVTNVISSEYYKCIIDL